MKKWAFLLVAMLVTFGLLNSGCAEKEHSLTIAVSGQGNTVPATGTCTYLDGQSVTVSATPASGWKFDGWNGAASGTNATVSLLMDGKKSITANFSKITRNLTLAVNGNGSTNPTAGARIYDTGTVVDVCANPGIGWKFDGWSGDFTRSNTTVSIQIDGNKSLTANFSKITYNLALAVNGYGTTSPIAGMSSYDAGKVVSITANPGIGWKFDGWNGDVAGSNTTVSIQIDGNKSLTANFSKITYNLALAVNGYGTTSPIAGTSSYDAGKVVSITANPGIGWKFDNWSGGMAAPLSASTTVTLDSNRTVTANFSRLSYSLTLSLNGYGTTSPTAGARVYDAGTAVNITANPSSGWKFDSWSGGVATPSSASTTATLDSNKIVTANFSPASQEFEPYSLNIGTGSGDWNFGSIKTGDRIQFSFQAAGSTVSYLVLDPNGNSVFSTTGYGQSGGGSFVAINSGDYKLHFVSSGLPTSVITIRYTIYIAP